MKLKRKLKRLKNKPRLIFQLVIFAIVILAVVRSTDPEAYCPLGGILSIGSRWVNAASSCSMSENQIFLGVGLILGIFIIGKLFCSHVCPIGTVTEWLGRWGRNLKLQIKQIPGWLDGALRSLKYLLLLPVIYYTATSSELFCKTFEPYYATTSGFDSDVVFWYALPALLITIIGSFFIRQFWCKYLCPLGAISNLAAFSVFSLGTLALYFLLWAFGMSISIFWLFLVWVAGGFLLEVFYRKGIFTPFLRITRKSDTCTDCKVCDKACPYDIKVSQMKSVRHIDCTMCADCVAACPKKDTLTISGSKLKWIPAAATIAVIVLSLGFASRYELATFSERWGDIEESAVLNSYETVIKSVKCYGSASSFKQKIMRQSGIYGMDAYARSHRVVLYYDSSEIDLQGLKKAVFSPYKIKIRNFRDEKPEKLAVVYLGIMPLNDNVDNINFVRALQQSEHIYGFETNFGEPVRVMVYIDPRHLQPQDLIDLIQVKELLYKNREGVEETLKLNFKVEDAPRLITELETDIFIQHIFSPYQQFFTGFEEIPPSEIRVYEIGLPGVDAPILRRYLPHLSSHLSKQEGILGLETFYSDRPVGWVYFNPAQIDTAKIRKILTLPMQVTYSTGEIKEVQNPFKITGPSTILRTGNIDQLKARLQEKTTYLSYVKEEN